MSAFVRLSFRYKGLEIHSIRKAKGIPWPHRQAIGLWSFLRIYGAFFMVVGLHPEIHDDDEVLVIDLMGCSPKYVLEESIGRSAWNKEDNQ